MPMDVRKRRNGLAALVQEAMGADPFGGVIFVFVGKRFGRIKILCWDVGLSPTGSASTTARLAVRAEPMLFARSAGLIHGLIYSALTRGLRGNRRTGEVTHVILNAGDPAGYGGGESRDERAVAAKIRALGPSPSYAKTPHTWRTRPDPFVDVWPEVEALLRQDSALQVKTIWTVLNERHGGRFSTGQLRTLQRRVLAWRVASGPDREVFFAQTHVPGEQAQSDFTDMRALEVMIAGQLFPHLLYHFVLTYSNWESVSICPSESFESLSAGVQNALWRLGGVPIEHRADNLSAATHELSESRGRDFTERYRELMDHYGLRVSRNFPGNAHETGDVESANGKLKTSVDQQLRLRGSRAFVSREAYVPSCVSLAPSAATCSARRSSPTLEFRRTYDALVAEGSDQADLDYVRILHLAAGDGEETVRAVLADLLSQATLPTYELVRAQVRGPRPLDACRI
jgi:transposase